MANQITGKILGISPIQEIASKDGSKTFKKREILIDATRFDPYTGERGIENTPILEFSGDKCSELDAYQKGQVVTISFDLQGNKYQDKDGQTKYFTRVRAYKIEARQAAAQPVQQPVQQPAPQFQPTPPPPQQFPPDNGGLPW